MEGSDEKANGTQEANNVPQMVPEAEQPEIIQQDEDAFPPNPSERIIDEGSLDDRVPMSDEMLDEPKEFDDLHNKSTKIAYLVRKLNEKT